MQLNYLQHFVSSIFVEKGVKIETKTFKKNGNVIEELFEDDVLIRRTVDDVEQDLRVTKRGSKISLKQDKLEKDEHAWNWITSTVKL